MNKKRMCGCNRSNADNCGDLKRHDLFEVNAPKHTPGPWVAGWSGDPDTSSKDFAGPISLIAQGMGSLGYFEPNKDGHANTWEIVEANVDFILRAVNSHDELLAAAKAALEHFPGRLAMTQLSWSPRDQKTIDLLKHAIKKAQGSEPAKIHP